MWISKQEYQNVISALDAVKNERDEWKAKYKAVTEDKIIYRNAEAVTVSIKVLNGWLEEGGQAIEECKALRAELVDLKKKYADEVQKRLALIEQMEAMNG